MILECDKETCLYVILIWKQIWSGNSSTWKLCSILWLLQKQQIQYAWPSKQTKLCNDGFPYFVFELYTYVFLKLNLKYHIPQSILGFVIKYYNRYKFIRFIIDQIIISNHIRNVLKYNIKVCAKIVLIHFKWWYYSMPWSAYSQIKCNHNSI